MIPTLKVPTFNLTLPVTGRKILYRPFVVREEKLLIMAAESEGYDDLIRAVADVVSACTNGAVDALRDPLFELQYAFLHIRGKSIGEKLDFNLVCGQCEKRTPASVDIDEFAIRTTDGHTNRIDLGDGMGVIMRYPTFRHFQILHESVDPDDVYRVVGECIESVYTEEEVFPASSSDEMFDFVQSMTPSQIAALQEFFATMPVLEKLVTYTCPECQTVNEVEINGINHFFE